MTVCAGSSGLFFKVVCVLLGTGLMPGLSRGEEPVGQALSPLQDEMRRKQLSTRGFDDEWQLLSDNYADYQRLPESERERYRKLYRELETNRDRDNLLRLLDRYYEWLEGLSPFERQSIRSEAALDKKIARIRELRALEAEKVTAEAEKSAAMILKGTTFRATEPQKTPEKGNRGSPQDGDNIVSAAGPIFEAIEARMLKIGAINDQELESIKDLSGWQRHLALIRNYLPYRWRRTSEKVFNPETRDSIAKIYSEHTGKPVAETERVPQIIVSILLMEFRQEYLSASAHPERQKELLETIRATLTPDERRIFDGKTDEGKLQFFGREIFQTIARSNELRPLAKRGARGSRGADRLREASPPEKKPADTQQSKPFNPAGGL